MFLKTQLSALFHTLCVGTKRVERSAFILLFVAINSNLLIAQPLQKIYSDLDNATSISVTQNSIYVVEQGQNRLLKLDHDGQLLETIGGKGSGDYQFSKPVDVDATNGLKIFITDFNNRRVQVFDRRGQYLSSISGRDSFGVNRRYNPTQIALSNMGEVYFVDENARYIRHFDLDYNLLDEFRISNDIESVDELAVSSSEIFILDRSSQTIHRLASNGRYEGFYPAEEIRAMFVGETGIWTASSKKLMFEPNTGELQSIEFQQSINPIDLHVEREQVYILTANELFKLSVPVR
ncbi:MAG: NHL repeat-containing protein [Gracilimonas sp.]